MENQKGSDGVKSLSLTDLISAFIILGLGYSFAFLVFLIKRIIHLTLRHTGEPPITPWINDRMYM